MKTSLLIFLFLAYSNSGIALDEYVWLEECNKNQSAMGKCAYEKYEHYEAHLDDAFSRQLHYLETAHLEYKKNTNYKHNNALLLKEAQDQWLKFRDAECKYQSEHLSSGSLYRSVQRSCLAAMAKKRILALEKYLVGRGGDCPF